MNIHDIKMQKPIKMISSFIEMIGIRFEGLGIRD